MNRPRRDSGISSRAAPTRNPAKRTDPLVAGGEMGALMRSMDWSETPLGPVARWSESLRTTVSTCLNSRFPILVFWGPDMVMLYNDSYRPMLGNKHPSSLGRPGRQAWGEIWHIIGPMLDGVRHHGLATWSEDQALQVRRRGFLEEAYFTFSYSPVRDESGQVGGIFTVVAETTSHVLDARRFKTLQEIPARTIGTTSVRDACAKALLAIEANPADFPFALLYSLDVTGKEAHLEVQTGLVSGATVCPERIDLQHEDDRTWPLLAAARQHRALRIEHLSERFGALSLIDERPVPSSAILLPVERPGSARPVALLVVGLSPRLLPDEKYLGFLDLVAGSLAASISSAHAYELETRRAESLAELDMAKTAFFSNVSHEFRTPLTLMLGPIEDSLADREEPLPPSQRERQLLVRRNGLRLQKLVNTLLEFARIGAGRARVAYCATDLAMLTRDLVSSFDSAMAGAGLVLRVDCPPLPEPVYVDHAMWEKIVLNLLSNALKFTFQGEVRVSLRWQGDHVSLSVSDTGTGIPAQELPRIFERFHRVEGARGRSHEGTGIGLALVQEIVRLHGGRVSVQSVLGQGTSFTVCLPTGDQHVPVECREAPSSALEETALGPLPYLAEASQWQDVRTPPPPGPRVHERLSSLPAPHAGARILVADDNADMRSYLVRLLSPFWQVEEVGDGMQALEAVRDRMHDLVISDVMMPGLDGLALARALRTDEQTRMVQVILLSARAGEEATIEGLKSGADEYLVKPFSANELIARVHAQLTVSELRRQAVEQERAHTEEANRLLAESRRATQLREETLAVVSHDLRTPLTAIKMAIDLMQLWLQDDERDRKLRKQTDSIRRSITRMNRLISDLLDLASIDAGTLALDTQRRSPAELLHEAHDVFAMQAAQKGLELTLDLEDGLPALECDRERILQVLNNLLANAFQFTPAGGHVRLSARRGEEGVLFVVSDDGSGIASDALPHIFDRYWHSAAHGRESHGLGLSIAAGIVKAHGGTLDVWSSEGEGSRFSFMLPVAFAAQEAGAHLGAMEHARPSRPEHASGFSGAPLGGVGDDFLTGGGEMGKLIRALDWDETPLGPTSSWPQSLRTTVSLCLAAHLPTSITWGPKHVQIYNDGYSRFCGGKHPHALGQSFSECWASAWPAVGPAFERALEGETQYLENVRMFLDRHGDLEETFFSFSNSPLRDESGGIGGLFHQVTENTASVLSERRTRVLRDLAARLGKAYTLDAVYAQTAGTLTEAALDVPFMLLYALEGRTLRLVARTALSADCAAAPPWLELDATMPWPLAEVLHSGVSAQLDDVGERLQGECCGPYPELPRSALAIPIKPAGAESAALCLVLGLSARLPKSAAYLDFLELLASTLSASVSGARAGEVERTRGESQQLAERARMQLAMAQMPKPTLGQQTRQAELEQALRARDEFLIVVSHELRTPVAALAMQLETLSPRRIAELSAEALRTRSEALVQRMKRLTRQVNELVVVAKLITEHVPLSRAPTDLSELVSAAVEELREEALRLHCSVTVQSSQHLVGGFDRGRLLQAFVNLLDNALKFGAGKPVDVRVVGEPGHAVVSFVDRGQGVTAADEERIFQRFQRAVSSSHYGGFGLGLWTVQQIVQAHEGSVRVAHTAGGGATFEVRLPLS